MGAMQFRSLPGFTKYSEVQKLQYSLVEDRLAGTISDTTLFLEHSPVITRGRGLQWTGVPREKQMPLPVALPTDIELCESERGGDLTYHGPGQLVVYPICHLNGQGFGPERDVTGFIRKLELVCQSVLHSFGLSTRTVENATGIWVETPQGARKIASIGIAVRKWVTFHGLALNVVNDLAPFQLFSPCGFQPEVMTSLKALLPDHPALQSHWRTEMEKRWEEEVLLMAAGSRQRGP